jgi:hypothetical protein
MEAEAAAAGGRGGGAVVQAPHARLCSQCRNAHRKAWKPRVGKEEDGLGFLPFAEWCLFLMMMVYLFIMTDV